MLVIWIKKNYFWKPFGKENLLFKTMSLFSFRNWNWLCSRSRMDQFQGVTAPEYSFETDPDPVIPAGCHAPFTFIRQSQPPLTRHSDTTYHHITTRLWRASSLGTRTRPRAVVRKPSSDQTRRPQSSSGLNHHPSHTGNNYCI